MTVLGHCRQNKMATINDVLSLSLVLFPPQDWVVLVRDGRATNPLVLDWLLSLRLGIAQLTIYLLVAQLSLSQFEILSKVDN